LQNVSVLEGHPRAIVNVQKEDGHKNLFSLRTGHNSIHELVEEEEEEEEVKRELRKLYYEELRALDTSDNTVAMIK
jgi:hypothetical protein